VERCSPLQDTADADEAELLDELEQLEMEALGDQLTSVTNIEPEPVRFAQVPRSAPVAKPTSTQEREDAELASLQRAMQLEQPMPMPMMATCY